MTNAAEKYALVFALEGDAKPQSIDIPTDADARDVLALVRTQTGREDLVELLWEDADDAIGATERIVERLERDFRLIHAATGGKIEVTVRYERDKKSHDFRPSATIRRLIAWAISPKGFDLEGEPAEFQIKFDGRVVPPDQHIGQLTKRDKPITVTLVHNVKPQG